MIKVDYEDNLKTVISAVSSTDDDNNSIIIRGVEASLQEPGKNKHPARMAAQEASQLYNMNR